MKKTQIWVESESHKDYEKKIKMYRVEKSDINSFKKEYPEIKNPVIVRVKSEPLFVTETVTSNTAFVGDVYQRTIINPRCNKLKVMLLLGGTGITFVLICIAFALIAE